MPVSSALEGETQTATPSLNETESGVAAGRDADQQGEGHEPGVEGASLQMYPGKPILGMIEREAAVRQYSALDERAGRTLAQLLMQKGEGAIANGQPDEFVHPAEAEPTVVLPVQKGEEEDALVPEDFAGRRVTLFQIAPQAGAPPERGTPSFPTPDMVFPWQNQPGEQTGRAHAVQVDQLMQTLWPREKRRETSLHTQQTFPGAERLVASMAGNSQTSQAQPQPGQPADLRHSEHWQVVLNQAAERIVAQMRQDSREARLQLDPPELGKLDIQVVVEGERIHAHIVAESADVGALIQTHLPELKHALQSRHLALESVRVDVQGGGGDLTSSSQRFRQESHSSGQGRAVRQALQTKETESESSSIIAPVSHQGRVSVWA